MTKREYTKRLCCYPTALTVKEVAEILRISTKTVYKMLGNNTIPFVKVGRENRIVKGELINYLRHRDTDNTNPKSGSSEDTHNNVWTSQTTCDIVRVAKN